MNLKSRLSGLIRRRPALKALLKPVTHQLMGRSKNQTYDQETERLIRKYVRDGDNCVDVGCHAGEIMDLILSCSPSGHHVGFEPLPEFFGYIRKRYRQRANVTLHEVALADTSGEATFQRNVDNPGYSGLRRRDAPGAARVESLTVRLGVMDELLPADLPIRLIKIDVEGAELGVLRGARRTLATHRPYVVFEHGAGAAELFGTAPEHVFDLFDDLGYRLFPLSRGVPAIASSAEFAETFRSRRHYYFVAVPDQSDDLWA